MLRPALTHQKGSGVGAWNAQVEPDRTRADDGGDHYSVNGSLVDAEGEPVALLTGEAYEGQPKGRKVTVFTNRVGRFGAQGLRPGCWVLDMATEAEKDPLCNQYSQRRCRTGSPRHA
jgi:outer membrane usher protein